MVERVGDYISDSGERAERPADGSSVASDRRDLVGSVELRKVSLPRRWFGGYRRAEVDDVLERAAATIAELERVIDSNKSELEQSRQVESASEGVIALMLQTAARVIEEAKEDAKREAAELVSQARNEADVVGRLHEEAQATLESARLEAAGILAAARPEVEEMTRAARAEADGMLAAARAEADGMLAAAGAETDRMLAAASAQAETLTSVARAEAETLTSVARAEREQLLTDAARKASEARVALEEEKTAIDHVIDDLRTTWATQISDALARLDAIDPSSAAQPVTAEATTSPNGPSAADLALELRDRLSDGAGARPAAPVEETDAARGE
jgi:DivIVA domain-containing protein